MTTRAASRMKIVASTGIRRGEAIIDIEEMRLELCRTSTGRNLPDGDAQFERLDMPWRPILKVLRDLRLD